MTLNISKYTPNGKAFPDNKHKIVDQSHYSTKFDIVSPNIKVTDDYIYSNYSYNDTSVITEENFNDHDETQSHSHSKLEKKFTVIPYTKVYNFKLERKLPKLGLMMVGWGGNNGSTLTAALLAHMKGLHWETKNGIQYPNYFGSVMMSSTVSLGKDAQGLPVYVPFHSVLPMVDPSTIVVGGWDISSADLADAMDRASVLEPDLKKKIRGDLKKMRPLPSIFNPDFVASNQAERADNVLVGSLWEQLETVRGHIKQFKEDHELDKIIVVWTANTERYSEIITGINDTSDALIGAIKRGHSEIAPSTLYAVASIMENCPFINGSPQNTFVPGLIELAIQHRVPIGGDDFKSGQTKLKSVLVDFLVNAGIKPLAITSYNHLGNNDGKNLSAPSQFRSKEISKSNVVDDMVSANNILFSKENESPDHVVVIKYVPAVGDSKRALDEYESEIFMGGRNTISIHNTCEDSLLASPLILDLVLLTELLSRIEVKRKEEDIDYQPLHPVLSHLSYLLKAPLVPDGTPVVNALFKQRLALENFFRAVLGLPPQTEMELEQRLLPPTKDMKESSHLGKKRHYH